MQTPEEFVDEAFEFEWNTDRSKFVACLKEYVNDIETFAYELGYGNGREECEDAHP